MVFCLVAGKRWWKPNFPRHPTPFQLWHNSSTGMILELSARMFFYVETAPYSYMLSPLCNARAELHSHCWGRDTTDFC